MKLSSYLSRTRLEYCTLLRSMTCCGTLTLDICGLTGREGGVCLSCGASWPGMESILIQIITSYLATNSCILP